MISLRRMTENEFRIFLDLSIPEYAREKVKAGNWNASESMEKSRNAFDKLLPKGLESSGHHLFTIMYRSEPAGRLWLGFESGNPGGSGFIYDVYIEETYRRRGIARGAMLLLENEARSLGAAKLALHTFGYNSAARALYEGLGYEITNINMAKTIS